MKKIALGVAVIFLLALTPTWAAKFWEEADFLEWTEKDVLKMLNKSPWSKQVSISAQGSRGPTGTTMRTGRRDGPRAGGGGFPGGGGGGVGGFPPSLTLTIRWYSSKPVKKAVAEPVSGMQQTQLPRRSNSWNQS